MRLQKALLVGSSLVLLIQLAAHCGELHDAVKSDDLVKVKEILSKGINANIRDDQGGTPLLYATVGGHLEIAKALLKAGADTESATAQKLTPLCYAAYKGHEEIVKLLIENKAKVSVKDSEGTTPLLLAAKKGFASIVRILVANKADVNERDNDGWQAIHYAALNGFEEIVINLIDAGADINSALPNAVPPRTPIILAAWNGHESIAKLLIQHKASDDWLTKIDGFPAGEKLRPFVVSRAQDGRFTHGTPTGLSLLAWEHFAKRPWQGPKESDTSGYNIYSWDKVGRGDYLSLLWISDAQHNETKGEFLVPAYISPDQVVYPDGVSKIASGGPFATIKIYWSGRNTSASTKNVDIPGEVAIDVDGHSESIRPNVSGEFIYLAHTLKRWNPVSIEFKPKGAVGQKRIEFDCVLRGATPKTVVYSVFYESK